MSTRWKWWVCFPLLFLVLHTHICSCLPTHKIVYSNEKYSVPYALKKVNTLVNVMQFSRGWLDERKTQMEWNKKPSKKLRWCYFHCGFLSLLSSFHNIATNFVGWSCCTHSCIQFHNNSPVNYAKLEEKF